MCKQQCIVCGKECGNRCGNYYLSKGMTIESKMADTKGSTATVWPKHLSSDMFSVCERLSSGKSDDILVEAKPHIYT